MFSLRTVVGSAIAAVALFASVQGTSAVQIDPAATTQIGAGAAAIQGPLAVGSVYELNPTLGAGAFTHYYKFDVPAPGVDAVTLIQVHLPNPGAGEVGVANLQLSWLDSGFNLIPGGFLDITNGTGQFEPGVAQNSTFTKSLAAASPVYLLVEGSRIGDSGRYNFNLIGDTCRNCGNEVPVPGAVFLFGSVLAGGVGGMQLMRRRRMSRAA